MNKFLHALRRLVAAPLCLVAFSAAAQAPQPPEIAARAYLLLDVTANQILAAKDIDSPVEPASLTKLMTAYLVFEALKSKKIDLKQTLPVSERAWKMPGSRMFIDPKMQVPVEDLIKGMIVQSGNDATVALAEGVGGSVERFVQLMNAQAKAMGLNATTYKNPEGLTEAGHTTTARDLSVLATRLMRDFPEYVGYYAVKKYRYPGHAGRQRYQSQQPAVSRPDGGRPENRPHRSRRLLPGGDRQARLSQLSAGAGCCRWCWAHPARTPAPTSRRSC